MKSLIFILLISPLTLFCQADYGILKLEVSFDKLSGLNQRINGKIKIDNKILAINKGNLILAQTPGEYQVYVECWMNALCMSQIYSKADHISISKEDTTILKILIPDSLVRSVDYLPILDKKGTFFPLVDSLAFLDEEGKKYGIFTSPRSYIGDCLNYFGTTYVLYDSDNIILQVDEVCDMNFCYQLNQPYSITFTKHAGNEKIQFILFPNFNKCNLIDDGIYFRIGQEIDEDDHGIDEMIKFFRMNIRKNLDDPFIFLGEELKGMYLKFRNDVLLDTIMVK